MFPKRVTNRNPRLHTPHGSAFSSKAASVQFHRAKAQFSKKYGKTGSDIVGSMQSEVGWVGLCLLTICLIVIVYVVLMIVSASEHSPLADLEAHKDTRHSDEGDAMDHMRSIDPEHWPHHEQHTGKDIPNDRDNDVRDPPPNFRDMDGNNRRYPGDNPPPGQLNDNGGSPPLPGVSVIFEYILALFFLFVFFCCDVLTPCREWSCFFLFSVFFLFFCFFFWMYVYK